MKTIPVLLVCLAVVSVRPAYAAYSYALIDVPGGISANAYGLANDGSLTVVTVTTDSLLRAPAGTYSQIEYPDRDKTTALGMNNLGVIVGDVASDNPSDDYFPGFIRAADGSFSTFTYPGVGPTATGMQTNDVNDDGVIVGGFRTTTDSGAFIRHTDGSFSSFQYLSDPRTIAYGINNSGQISGWSLTAGSFLREADGSFVSVAFPGASETNAFGINNLGQVTGLYFDGAPHGFVRNSDGSFVTLDFPGATVTTPWAINDDGTVVGTALIGGQDRAFIATITTVPEPSALSLTVLGGLAVIVISIRRRVWHG